MRLTLLDWFVITIVLVIPVLVSLWYYRRASSDLGQFFLSGRDLSWWLAGTSMVATTFAADTPLVVAGLVAANGVSGNWLWWNAGLGSMLTVFFFARLWRRAGIVTDIEFTELRYTGPLAALLRSFRAFYLGLPLNCLIIGWVSLAMSKVLSIMLGWNQFTAVFVGLAATGLYSSLAGLRGVVITDFIQFGFAMAGSVALAWFAVTHTDVGGVDGLITRLPSSTFELVPQIGVGTSTSESLALPITAFMAYLGVQWWASWYPGQEPGGGGYIAQRMMSTRNERHSLFAMLWFAVAHYCIRPWPWVLVALASLVLYPGLTDAESGYALVMRDHLPAGWRGLLVGSFFAAYMSTVSTQLNWGASYLVNDIYLRFLHREASSLELVRVSRIATLAIMALSVVLTFYLENVRQAWEFALESGAGVGLVLILRWYWWRINAASELSALLSAAIGFIGLRMFTDISFPDSLLYLVPWTTACWLTVTWLTPAEPMSHLVAFYTKIRPAGPGWAPVAAAVSGEPTQPASLTGMWLDWVAGCIVVYGILFGVAGLLFGSPTRASGAIFGALLAGIWLYRGLTTKA